MKKNYLIPSIEVGRVGLLAFMHSASVKEFKSGGKKTYGGDADETQSTSPENTLWNNN
ncbi:MAG: hypothetical protein J6M19_05675 [Bacteroidaceae bacterium]|nr:hypothetical protein [Bacteroidaceae bacterium]